MQRLLTRCRYWLSWVRLVRWLWLHRHCGTRCYLLTLYGRLARNTTRRHPRLDRRRQSAWSRLWHSRLYLVLLHRLLVSLLQRLHLLLLLVATVNSFSDRTTNRTTDILTPVIVAQDVARTDTMRYQTFLILAFGDMLPQSLHAGTVRSYRTSPVFVLTLGSVP